MAKVQVECTYVIVGQDAEYTVIVDIHADKLDGSWEAYMQALVAAIYYNLGQHVVIFDQIVFGQ